MKLSFTTLGCPAWDFQTILSKAKEYGFDGIDFRGILGTLDVTTMPEFRTGVAATKRMIESAGLEVSGISTSICICDDTKHAQFIEEAKRTIPVALELGCANVRVFGGGDVKRLGKEKAAQVGRDCLREILRLEGATFLNWNLETHDNWTSGQDILYLLDSLDHPSVGVLWDLGHPPRFSGEKPEETYKAIGRRVKYTHVKDAIHDPKHPHAAQDGWRYVSPGEGSLPLAESVTLLKRGGYDGYLTLEHEKRWHQDLPEPEEAFPKYVAWGRKMIKG